MSSSPRIVVIVVVVVVVVLQDEGTTFMRDVRNHSPNNPMSHPRRPESSQKLQVYFKVTQKNF
jgi:hypothetical protein